MSHTGRCYCGAIRYRVEGEPKHVAICHCKDCQRSSGAPMTTWAAFAEAQLTVTQGEPRTINGAGAAIRSFCGECGTGLFYRNAQMLPGIVDVQSVTLDDPAVLAPEVQIQTAERIAWMIQVHELPAFERFPS